MRVAGIWYAIGPMAPLNLRIKRTEGSVSTSLQSQRHIRSLACARDLRDLRKLRRPYGLRSHALRHRLFFSSQAPCFICRIKVRRRRHRYARKDVSPSQAKFFSHLSKRPRLPPEAHPPRKQSLKAVLRSLRCL